MRKRTPESEVLDTICEYLAYRGFFFWRTNNTPVFDRTRNVFRAMPKWSVKGVSDIILIHEGTPWFIEVKAEKGAQSEDQKHFEKNIILHGGRYLLVRSIEDLTKQGF